MRFNRVLALVLTIVALAVGQNAWAQTFTIEASHNNSTNKTTFTITRSGSSLPQQTINYRTVNLSAYAGIHYTAVSDSYTFPEGITSTQVEVSENSQYSNTYGYHYQTGTSRSYRFEVLDVNGFELAHDDHSMTTGAQFSTNYLNQSVTDLVYFNNSGSISSGSGNKYLDVSYSSSDWTQVTDAGYDQGVHTVSTNSLYNSNINLRTILNGLSYKMYATVYFTQKEEKDGYQYIQIYTGNASTYDNVDDPDGGIGTLTNSLYRACFILSYSPSGSVMSDEHYQFFPHRYDYVDKATDIANGITNYEFDYDNSHLYAQKFKSNSYKASTSGSLVLSPTDNNINIRFDAGGGGNDKDQWDFKDLKVRLALVDETYPTLINTAAITVSAGPYVKGNTFYISVPFSEIVNTANYSNNKKLVTSWGDATYYSGDGTNVITFKGTINANAGTTLAITSVQCNFKDLANNYYQGIGNSNYTDSFDKTFNGVTSSATYTLAATNTSFTGLADEYVLSNNGPIEPIPTTVYFYKGIVNSTNQVTLAETTNYTLAWADNTAAGNGTITATGAGSYTGSASTTFPIRWATYTIRFHSNYGTDETSDQSFTYNTAQNLTANAFTRTGYTFDHWTTNADGSGDSYTDGQNVNNLTPVDGAVIDLYAQWTAHTYTVNFYRNDGTVTTTHQAFTYGVAQHLTANAFTRTGCIFEGWNTAADGSGDNYADGQEVINLTPENRATVTLYAQWNDLWDVKNGADGSEAHPYLITTTAGLDLLASDVNSGTDYSGKYFKLDADIAYDPNALDANGENYTTIGGPDGSIIRKFNGTFDGDGHTVSGIRINKTGTDTADRFLGLFGYLGNTGTVQNVILNDARITGYDHVGGIAGFITRDSSIKNCCVLNTAIIMTNEGTDNVGVISGSYYSNITSNYTSYKQNYYHNCSITQGGTTSTTNIGAESSDCYGARSVHTLTLPTDVTATGESVTISGTTYYVSAYQVTLNCTPPDGYALGYTLNGTPFDGNTFTMPASDAIVNVSLSVIDYETVNAGTEADPYIIYNKDQLDMLANRVNSGINEYGGKFFKLGNDIDYQPTTAWDDATSTEDNYTAIGNNNNAFCGTFDGDGHTISGIRIYKSSTSYQGLFGRVYAGTVKNVTLSDARITGGSYVGGISGQTNGNPTIQDCLVLNTCITASSDCGAVVGYMWDGTLTNNHYQGCTVNGTANATNVGVGYERGIRSQHDRDGARSVYALSLPGNVTATGESVTIGSDTYYASNTTITLSYTGELSKDEAPLFTVTKTDDNSVVAKTMGDFTMPAADVSISFELFKGYTLTLSDGITASGITTPGSDESNKYYVTGTIVTLSYSGSASTGYAPVYSVNGTAIESNTFTMPASDASVSFTVTDVWGMEGGADGSEQHPYIITTPVGLNLLASNVNSGTGYNGQFFKLGNDIAYPHITEWDDASSTENNYTAIGNNSHPFRGTFDGDSHTISGIRIYMPDDNYQGLFGYVDAGTVKNVTISDARITGKNRVAGIAGCTEYVLTKIDNCLILNAAITAKDYYGGVLVGYKGNGTYSHNFYHNCIVKVGSDTYTTGIGLGAPRNDYVNEVSTVYALTLSDHITASPEAAVIYNGIRYYTAGTTVTLAYSEGYTLIGSYTVKDSQNNDVPLTGGNTFTMPASDVSVSATIGVPYIDAQGAKQTCTDFTVLTSSNSGQELGDSNNSEAWYVVNSDVTIGGKLNFNDQTTHLILCDGATLTVNGGDDNGISCLELTIYGQSGGTGTVSATGDGSGIIAGVGSVTINGGTITATGNGYGITADGSITINGGSVNATGGSYGSGINSTNGDITINGGTVNATGGSYGILASTITLGWRNASDRIYANSYDAYQSVQVKPGQYLTDGTNIYSGTINKEIFNDAVASKTLMGVELLYDAPNNNTYNNNRIANLDGKETNIFLNGRTLYKDGAWNTLCLPFSVTDGDNTDNVSFTGTPLEGATVMTLGNSTGCNTGFDATTGVLTLDFVDANEIEPGVAYIVKWNKADGYVDDDEHNLVNPVFTGVTIENEAPADHAIVSEDHKVSFIGTYAPTPLAKDDQSNLFLGAGNKLYWPNVENYKVNAFRAYFHVELGTSSVRSYNLFFGDGDASGIVSMEDVRGKMSDAWHTVDGRKLDGMPVKKGLYIHEGRTVVIK